MCIRDSVNLSIPRRDENDADPQPPSKEQIAGYQLLKDDGPRITENVLAALLKDYTQLRKRWLKQDPDLESELPAISTTKEMRKHVGVGIVHVHDIAKSGHAYIGLELGCTWDEEHGAGVILHKSRVIAAGQADTSFDTHAAIKDGGKRIKA